MVLVVIAGGVFAPLYGCGAVSDLFADPPSETPQTESESVPEACGSGEDCLSECYRPYVCASECGAPTIDCGCCECPEGMVDVTADCPDTAQPSPNENASSEDEEPGATCQSDTDCQTCAGPEDCSCSAVLAEETCAPIQARCVRDPCGGKSASCVEGQCVLRPAS